MADEYEEALRIATERARPQTYEGALSAAPQPNPAVDLPVRTLQGVNRGLANFAGMPFDASRWIMERILGRDLETPLGAEGFGKGLAAIGSTYETLEDVPEAYRPYARGGETVGEALPAMLAPYGAAARLAPTEAAKGMFAAVVEAARKTPGLFGAAEASAAASAGAGGGAAYAIDPDNIPLQIGAEIGMGTLNPTAMITRQLGKIPGLVGRIRAMGSQSGREASAGQALNRALAQAGEDPTQVVQSLQADPAIPGLQYPSAAKAGSPTLAALEANLIKQIPDVGNNIRQQMAEATQSLNRAYQTAVESGNPQAIREASRARQDWFETMLAARLGRAEEARGAAIGELAPTQTAADASEAARTRLTDAIRDARRIERGLWERVPTDIEINPTGTTQAYVNVRADMLPEQRMPAPTGFDLEAFLRRAQEGPVTSGDLQQARSLTLQEADTLRAAGDFRGARLMDNLADGMLEDIAGLSEEARSFSAALNNVYRRPNVERVTARTRSGAVRVAPEETLERTMARGGVGGNVAARELEEAAQFGGRTMVPEQRQFLRNMAMNAVNDDGSVNLNRLSNFVNRNQDMIGRMGLEEDLASVESAQRLVDDIAGQVPGTRRAVQNSAFARIAGFEDPVEGIRQIMGGRTPMQDFRQLATTARRAGPDAVSGLRGATFDFLFDVTQDRGLTSGRLMREVLTRRSGNAPNLLETMQDTGVLNARQRDNLMRVVDETERLEGLLESGRQVDEILEGASGLEDLLTRVIGANIGGMGAIGQISGTPLVAAHAGSQYARQAAQQIPMAKTREILGQAIQDPEYMALLMRRARTPAERAGLQRQINAYLLQTAVPEQDVSEEYAGP